VLSHDSQKEIKGRTLSESEINDLLKRNGFNVDAIEQEAPKKSE